MIEVSKLKTRKLTCDGCSQSALFTCKSDKTNSNNEEDAELYLCENCAKLVWQRLVNLLSN
jgi:hypothetical protein